LSYSQVLGFIIGLALSKPAGRGKLASPRRLAAKAAGRGKLASAVAHASACSARGRARETCGRYESEPGDADGGKERANGWCFFLQRSPYTLMKTRVYKKRGASDIHEA